MTNASISAASVRPMSAGVVERAPRGTLGDRSDPEIRQVGRRERRELTERRMTVSERPLARDG